MIEPQYTNEGQALGREALPEGMLDYEARCAIRSLIRLYGFEEARELVAMYLNDEATRRHQ